MKAIQVQKFGSPRDIQEKEIPIPKIEQGLVRVRLYAAGINPNDAYTMTGTYAMYQPTLPYTPGFDGAGEIEAMGDNVEGWKIGDKVIVASFRAKHKTGTCAQTIVCDASTIFPMPENLSFEQAATIGIPGTIAYQAVVTRGQVKANQTVFIHGASGGVGMFAIQIAKAFGARVVGSSSTPQGRQQILDWGADLAIGHLPSGDQELIEATGGNGPQLIIEMLADQNLDHDLNALAKFGKIVIVGSRGQVTITPRSLMSKEATVIGVASPNLSEEEFNKVMTSLLDLIKRGQVIPRVNETYQLEDISQVFENLLIKKGNGKSVVLIP